jgi:hypothetical protein
MSECGPKLMVLKSGRHKHNFPSRVNEYKLRRSVARQCAVDLAIIVVVWPVSL